MFYLMIAVHIIVCLFLIFVVLLQTGKGAEMGASFGGGSNQTLFGSRGAATFLNKLTTVMAIVFMITSLLLAVASSKRAVSTVMPEEAAATKAAEQTPAPGTTGPVADPGAVPPAAGTPATGPVSETPTAPAAPAAPAAAPEPVPATK